MWKTYVAVLNNDLARNIPNFNNNGDQISSFQVPTKNSFTPIPSFFNYVWMLHCHKKGFHVVTVHRHACLSHHIFVIASVKFQHQQVSLFYHELRDFEDGYNGRREAFFIFC